MSHRRTNNSLLQLPKRKKVRARPASDRIVQNWSPARNATLLARFCRRSAGGNLRLLRKLFDFVTARLEQCQQTIGAAHVPRANDDEIRFAAAQITFDLRKPVAIADVNEALPQRWDFAKRFLEHSSERLGVAPSPRVDPSRAGRILTAGVDEQDQQERFRLAVVQVHKKGVVFSGTFQAEDRLGSGPGA